MLESRPAGKYGIHCRWSLLVTAKTTGHEVFIDDTALNELIVITGRFWNTDYVAFVKITALN